MVSNSLDVGESRVMLEEKLQFKGVGEGGCGF